MHATRPLIAFAFLADKFDQTGDIVQGLMPLFEPLVRARAGQPFNPAELAKALSDYYGMNVHPWAIEDWIRRLLLSITAFSGRMCFSSAPKTRFARDSAHLLSRS